MCTSLLGPGATSQASNKKRARAGLGVHSIWPTTKPLAPPYVRACTVSASARAHVCATGACAALRPMSSRSLRFCFCQIVSKCYISRLTGSFSILAEGYLHICVLKPLFSWWSGFVPCQHIVTHCASRSLPTKQTHNDSIAWAGRDAIGRPSSFLQCSLMIRKMKKNWANLWLPSIFPHIVRLPNASGTEGFTA